MSCSWWYLCLALEDNRVVCCWSLDEVHTGRKTNSAFGIRFKPERSSACGFRARFRCHRNCLHAILLNIFTNIGGHEFDKNIWYRKQHKLRIYYASLTTWSIICPFVVYIAWPVFLLVVFCKLTTLGVKSQHTNLRKCFTINGNAFFKRCIRWLLHMTLKG